MKIKANVGDLIEILLYDLCIHTGWVSADRGFQEMEMRCRAPGYFLELNDEALIMTGLDMIDTNEKKATTINRVLQIPRGSIKGFKNYGKGMHWPKVKD